MESIGLNIATRCIEGGISNYSLGVTILLSAIQLINNKDIFLPAALTPEVVKPLVPLVPAVIQVVENEAVASTAFWVSKIAIAILWKAFEPNKFLVSGGVWALIFGGGKKLWNYYFLPRNNLNTQNANLQAGLEPQIEKLEAAGAENKQLKTITADIQKTASHIDEINEQIAANLASNEKPLKALNEDLDREIEIKKRKKRSKKGNEQLIEIEGQRDEALRLCQEQDVEITQMRQKLYLFENKLT